MPALIATLVSTWYGGILGVGEYSYQFGISQWLIFGAPYYVFAVLFALLLAGRIRRNVALTIPEALERIYGPRSGGFSALLIFVLVSPAPYILMLAILFQYVTGMDGNILVYASFIALFSVGYVSLNGYHAVVRTDMLQAGLMFGGFGLMIILAAGKAGLPWQIWGQLPDIHRDATGGHGIQFVIVWFFIALWTFVDPGFHQRAASAKNPKTARNGILYSVGFWFVFDFFTVFSGLYGFLLLQNPADPALVYPELATLLMPAGLLGLFFVTLIATMMSTLDSKLLLSGQTLGRDLFTRYNPTANPVKASRWAMLLSAVVGIVLIYLYPGVIDLWYVIGSVIIPGLLLPVLGVYLPFFRVDQSFVLPLMVVPFLISLLWLTAGTMTTDDLYSYAFLGVEPFYPGLFSGLMIWSTCKLYSLRCNR